MWPRVAPATLGFCCLVHLRGHQELVRLFDVGLVTEFYWAAEKNIIILWLLISNKVSSRVQLEMYAFYMKENIFRR